jgi:hypothetical protein
MQELKSCHFLTSPVNWYWECGVYLLYLSKLFCHTQEARDWTFYDFVFLPEYSQKWQEDSPYFIFEILHESI